jgi:hypothetical protein
MLRLSEDDYILFKNKDFGRAHFDDRIVVESDVFGVEGITTWADSAAELDRFSGFSIGANEHGLLCCDSNVRTLEDHASYDDLVEVALRQGTDVASAVQAVRRAVATRPYLWGNLMMMDSSSQAALEVRGQQVVVLQSDGPAARTNHHAQLGVHPEDDDRTTTEKRLVSAQRYVEAATSLGDVLALLGSHDDGDTGICNHALYQTVYSYILHHHIGTTTLYVSQGRPCVKPLRYKLALPLGERWSAAAEVRFRASYPSEHSTIPAI